jgi:hypothetical protein
MSFINTSKQTAKKPLHSTAKSRLVLGMKGETRKKAK